ncbi:MAG: substrate-binding domain-containing protein [Pseudomonadota bacterium]
MRPPTPLPAIFDGRDLSVAADSFRVALLVPMCGAAGIWGPSCIASAQLAVRELNAADGIKGRPVELIMIDSAIEAKTPTEVLVGSLIAMGVIDAVVGMHISAVHQRLLKTVRSRVPYVYTPLYEGGERTPGVFAIGDTPDMQLGPAIEWLHQKYRHRKWGLVGNDYIWPRISNIYAKRKIAALGGEIAYERYLPFGSESLEDEVLRVAESGAEAVLMTLIGQDAVDFNRAFGHAAMDRRMIRLSCVLEENCVLACGADSLRRMYSAASYFGALQTDENTAFKERYFALHGDRAPMLNSIGQSLYEGFHFLHSLLDTQGEAWAVLTSSAGRSGTYKSARRKASAQSQHALASHTDMYLARADGIGFEIISRLSPDRPRN